MSFPYTDFFLSDLPQDLWSNCNSFVSASTETPGISKAVQPLDLSIMNEILADRPPTLSRNPHPDQYGRAWSASASANRTSQSQNPSYNFEQYIAGGINGNPGSMLHFQGNIMTSDQEHFQNQHDVPPLKKSIQSSKRRDRSSKYPRNRPSQKRKRTSKVVACDYLNRATCGEDCNSNAGSSTTCCSSCSEGVPCVDPHCAIPCAESSCEKPICPEDCPISTVSQGQQMQFQQGFIPSSERLSFLQETNTEPWNPVGSRRSPSIKEAYIQNSIDPALADPDRTGSLDPLPQSSGPTTPCVAQNEATPYSPEAALQTPQFVGNSPQVAYSNEPNPIIGTGRMFNSAGDWPDNFANTGHNPLTSSCGWYGCNELVPNEIFWQHLHRAHVDPQISYPCPLESTGCPSTLETDALNHLQTQHGFDMNENFSCPAPTCSPAETYNDPAMFHNHFDQAHSFPAQGFLHCRLHSCNDSFLDPNQLLSHISESHQLPVLSSPKIANDEMKVESANYPLSIPDNEELVEHTCKWKVNGGSVCGQIFETEKYLQDHVKTNHLSTLNKNTGYICQWENCNRPAKMGDKQGFSQRGKLERHMASHTNYKCCQCDICGQFFSAEQAMKQHKLLHTGEKPWKCKYCDKCFPQQSACTIHERTHTKDKPLQCDVCGKRFSESSNFAKHRRTHGEIGKHACQYPDCGKNFHRSDQLKKHMKTHENHKNGKGNPSAPSSDAGTDDLTPSTDG